jgi:hypothetical protein
VAKPRPLRLARLIADLSNGTNQQPPIKEYPSIRASGVATREKAVELLHDIGMLRAQKQNREEHDQRNL